MTIPTTTERIGMCQACGGSFARSETVVIAGGEYCRPCADLIGGEPDEADEPEETPPDLAVAIERLPFEGSTNLASAGYDADTETLEAEFQTRKGVAGPIYRYGGVPRDVFAGLLTADSKGEYFDREVKRGGYPFRRVSPIFDEPVRPLGEGA